MSSMTYFNQQFHNYFVLFFGTIAAPLCTTSFNFPVEKISNEICCIHPSSSFQDSRKLYLILKTFFKKVSDLLAVDIEVIQNQVTETQAKKYNEQSKRWVRKRKRNYLSDPLHQVNIF